MARGRIVLIPFPFDDLVTSKVRPALCLTNSIGPNKHIVAAFITSKLSTNLLESDLTLIPTDEFFDNTGLKVPSTIQLHRLITISSSIIKRKLGSLPETHMKTALQKVKDIFK